MTDILAAIDAAIGCQQCGGDLGVSPSDDFCSETCQAAWHHRRSDQPMPERTSGWVGIGEARIPASSIEFDLSRVTTDLEPLGIRFRQLADSLTAAIQATGQLPHGMRFEWTSLEGDDVCE